MPESKVQRSADTITLDKKDLQQDDRLTTLENRLEMLGQTQNNLSLTDLGKIASIIFAVTGMLTTIAGMWLSTQTEPLRAKFITIESALQAFDKKNNSVERDIEAFRASQKLLQEIDIAVAALKEGHKDTRRKIESIKDSIIIEAQKLLTPFKDSNTRQQKDIEDIRKVLKEHAVALSETLDQAVLDGKFKAQQEGLIRLRAELDRVIINQLQPDIQNNADAIADIERKSVRELEHQRDLYENRLKQLGAKVIK